MRTLPISRKTADELTALLIEALAGLGHVHKRKDGTMQTVVIARRLLLEDGGALLLEVDTARLPQGVNAGDLVATKTTHHLGAVLHRPVKVLNTSGITYAVMLGPHMGKVQLPDAVDLAEVLPAQPNPWAFPLGAGPAGPTWETLRGNYLIGGEPGAGKTTWLLSTALALAETHGPAELRMVVIDPKAVDLLPLQGLGHLAMPVATDPDAAEDVTAWLLGEIAQRQRLFLRSLARDLDAYNAKDPAGGPLPRIVALIDEVTELALTAGLKSPFYQALIRLSSMGRAFGLHLVLATQNPKAEVLNTLIRGNLAGRVSFRVTTPEHSRAILGVSGAEQLPRHPGRLLARLGDGRLHALQGYQVADQVLTELVAAIPTVSDDGTAGPMPVELLLTDREISMVSFGVYGLEGRFGQAEVMAEGYSRREYRRLVNKLKAQELLAKDPAQGDALILDLDRLGPALTALDPVTV